MNEQTLNMLGIAGNVVLIVSYLPQIRKIIVTKKAGDLSILTWMGILIGDLMFLTYAIFKNDSIIASLFTVFTIENIIILYLTFRYGKINKPLEGKVIKPAHDEKTHELKHESKPVDLLIEKEKMHDKKDHITEHTP